MGDSIDNIKGVPGIGEKGARDLIATYGSLEALLEHAPESVEQALPRGPARATPRTRGRAASWRASAPTSRCRSSRRRCAIAAPRTSACFELFTRLGFRSLVLEYAPTAQTIGKDYARRRVRSTTCARWRRRSRALGRFGLRVLPDAPAAMRAGIVGISFSTGPRQARYVPLATPGRWTAACSAPRRRTRHAGLDRQAALDILKPLLEDERVLKVGHDLKFDAIVLARHGITLRGLETDVMIASYLLDATRSSHPLEDLAIEHAGYKALTRGGRLRPRREVGVVCVRSRRARRSTTPASAPTCRCSWRAR